MHGRSKLRRWLTPLAASSIIAGAAMVVGGATVLAWTAPVLTPLCASSTLTYNWSITLANETSVNNGQPQVTLDYSWGSEDTTTPAGSFTEPVTGGTFDFTTPRGGSSGQKLYVWYSADTSSVGSAAPEGTLCTTPTITTQLKPASTVSAGTAVYDTATLSGGESPTGDIAFTIYTNSTCSSAATTGSGNQVSAQGGEASVSGNGTYDSATVTFNDVGTYYWQASYSGDDYNNGALSTCNSETLTVTKATPSITTTLSTSSTAAGQAVNDSAKLSGASPNASGTVTFTVYTNSTCNSQATTGNGNQISAQPGSVSVSGNGTYDSAPITFYQVGTYYWQAYYAGDNNNGSATSSCTSEILTVSKTTPSITTTLGFSSLGVGQTDSDAATLSGATSNASGTVVFTVYTDNLCSSKATTGTGNQISAQPGSASVHGNGTYDSATITFYQAGTYYWQASYNGDGNNGSATSSCTSEEVTVSKAGPSITTTLSTSSIPVGQTVSDTADLSGATSSAGGTVTFTVYTNPTCSIEATTGTGNQISAQGGSAGVSGNGTYDSGTVTFYEAGTYYWQASYSGDNNNTGAKSGCTSETLTVTKLTPAITTSLSTSSLVAGQTDSDTATLSGATSNASGSVTFTVYTNNICTSAATTGTGNQISAQPGSASVSGNGTYASGTITFYEVGTYFWQASYAGDGNNSSVKSGCTSETVTVTKAAPSITTTLASSAIGVGQSDSDTASLSGASSNAGGSVTFTVYTNSTCGSAATTGSGNQVSAQPGWASVSGSGNYTSKTITFYQGGTYYWQAYYSGDGNNSSATSGCTSETLTVSKTTPTITTTLASSEIGVGHTDSDTATLAGVTSYAGGSVTFTIYTDDLCSVEAITGTGNQISGQGGSASVSGPGTYDSVLVTFYDAGTYYWQAYYSGDASNNSATSPCTSEIATVTKATPGITTTLSTSSTPAGQTVSDTADLSGTTLVAGGSVTFTIYTDDLCSVEATTGTGNQISGQGGSASVSGPGTYDSVLVTFYDAGTYYWQAYYSGDSNNDMATSPCTSETLTVTKDGPALTTQLSTSSSPAGQSVTDTATLTGATAYAGGTVTFTIYTDNECSSPATTGAGNEISAQGGSDSVSGPGAYDSATIIFYEAGTYYWQASYSGDNNNNSVKSGCTSETLTVTKLSPAITTTLSASSSPAGQSVSDTADLSGTTSYASGTVTFTIYTDNECSSPATTGSGNQISVQGGSTTVSGPGTYDSVLVTFYEAGTYYWQASYSGDSNDNSVKSGCTSETLTVTKLTPAITTKLSTSSSPVGQTVSDTADLSGATSNAGGTVTFTIYTDNECSSPATTGTGNEISAQGGSATVSGPGTYDSATITFFKAGTYYWQASYSGDNNNDSVKSGCTSETLTVTKLTPSITTTLSASSSPAGQTVSDTADLSGATADATGTVTFTIYTDNECSSPATTGSGNQISVQGGSTTVSGPGTYDSVLVTFYEAGTYYWQASYSGDSNDNSVKSGCTSETVTVTKDGTSLTTQLAAGTILVGATDHDTATLTGATAYAGGTVTFTIYSDDDCGTRATIGTGNQVSAQGGSATVSGSGTYDSATVTFSAAGTYYWQASYSGDSNNKAAVSACNAEPVTVNSPPTPTPVPTPTPTSVATPTPTGGVSGVTTPGTGAGPTTSFSLLGLILMLVGAAIFVFKLAVDRRTDGGDGMEPV
jgi:hypothetical protein